jgi:hypothetical protein
VALTYRLGVRCRFAKLRAVGLFGVRMNFCYAKPTDTLPSASNSAATLSPAPTG